jgi:hypothetical protein
MKYYENDGFAKDILAQKSSDHFNELAYLINNELSEWKNKFVWFRKESCSVREDEIPDNSLDCVFIDGDHSYLGAKADYLNFKTCSEFIFFHDVDILHKRTNVKQLWEEVKKEYPNNTLEFFNKSPEFQTILGIGALIKSQPKLLT